MTRDQKITTAVVLLIFAVWYSRDGSSTSTETPVRSESFESSPALHSQTSVEAGRQLATSPRNVAASNKGAEHSRSTGSRVKHLFRNSDSGRSDFKKPVAKRSSPSQQIVDLEQKRHESAMKLHFESAKGALKIADHGIQSMNE
jgi:hypothetical protein